MKWIFLHFYIFTGKQESLMFLAALIWFPLVHCLTGNRPPSIYIEPTQRDVYFKPGETVTIECVADGQPKPRYLWKRNDEDFNPSGQDDRVVQLPGRGTLVFNNPESKDEGIFQCFAENSYGTSVSVKVSLREAILKKFVYEPKRIHRVRLGNALTLPCVPPQSLPRADVYWVYRSADGRWEAVNFNKRITMDFEDRLRFTNVLKEDEAYGRTYCCMASNYFMRDNAIGPSHQVVVTGDTEYKQPPYELWTSPSDQFFLRGETLRLKCIFAGSPTPEVYWERIYGALPERASFGSFGQELSIRDLEFSDAGQYQCMGLNSQTTHRSTKAFNVRIESTPYWTKKPIDLHRGVGEIATFICEASGIPEPDYEWFINGVPLEDRVNKASVRDPRIYNNIRFFKPNKNNITLTNLTLDDNMNIQCNASNTHGYVFSDVFLNVLAEKPVIVKLPPPWKKVTEGQSVVLECLVTGKPDPVVTWYRDNVRITGGRFQTMSNGNLHISNAVMADAGEYRCEAYNSFGNATSSVCKTQIRVKTRITDRPGDLEVVEGGKAKFTCSGTTDFREAMNQRINWEKDGRKLYDNQQRVTQNHFDNSLTISGTIVRDSGVYTCVVTNGLDEDRHSAILTVKGRPDPPSHVTIERCHDDSAFISWVKGIENNAPVQYFIIQYSTSFHPDQWTSAMSVDYTQNTATVPLKPWGNYTFRVIAANKIGVSLVSAHTQRVCTTKPDRPEKNPRNLKSVGDTPNTLKIQWTPMNLVEHNGPGFKYILTVKELGGSRSDTFSINDWRQNSITLPSNQSAYSPYQVRLYAKNDVGDAKEETVERTLYSFEDIPLVRPYDVEVTNPSDTVANISFKWDPVWLKEENQRDEIKGELRGFKLQYWLKENKLGSFSEVDVYIKDVMNVDQVANARPIKSHLLLRKLTPYSSMQAQVRIFNNHYTGPPSDVASFQTLDGVPGAVTRVQVMSRSCNSITLSWKKPAKEDCHGIVIGYDIEYQTVVGLKLGLIQDQIKKVYDSDVESSTIGGLLPDCKYRIHLYARTRHGRGQDVFIEVSTTPVTGNPIPIIIDILAVTSTSINVTWFAGDSSVENLVHYVNFRKKIATAWQRTRDVVLRNSTRLTSLEAGTNYEIRVVAYDGYTRFYSQSRVVRTVGYASPRSLTSNYLWFVSMMSAGVVVTAASVAIFLLHKRWKNISDHPKFKKGALNAVKIRHFFHHRDSFAKKPLVKGARINKSDNKQHRHRGQGKRLYRGRLYKGVGESDTGGNLEHKGDVRTDGNESEDNIHKEQLLRDDYLVPERDTELDLNNGDSARSENDAKMEPNKIDIGHDTEEAGVADFRDNGVQTCLIAGT